MIYVEDELIKLNGVVLPGLVKSIEVIETAKVDEQEVEGSATKPKQATGYEDAKVNIELIIDDTPSQTKYQRYPALPGIKSKKQFKAGAVVAVALPYGDLTPAIIGEVEL